MKRLINVLKWLGIGIAVLVALHIVLNPAPVPADENAVVLYAKAFALMTSGVGVRIHPQETGLNRTLR
jgi:hypothetical protein